MKALLKNHRQSPRKVRLIADLIRGKKVPEALALLGFVPKRAALPVKKLLLSAVANAKNKEGKKESDLIVKEIRVDEGPTLKRIRARARGSAHPIRKRTSHISVALGEKEPQTNTYKTDSFVKKNNEKTNSNLATSN
ncbi:MAG: 50S ribosomal protein L22 [Candidatus Paceibacterota bacterium]